MAVARERDEIDESKTLELQTKRKTPQEFEG